MPEQSKFENMDLFASLEAIMKQNTGFYQSDLDIDKEIIAKAAASPHREDKTLLWFCRPSGTHCFRERDVFLKDTAPHNTWRFYMEQTSDRVLAYAIELTGKERGKIKGNLYELDYSKHYERVKEKELPADTVKLIYEHGERVQEAGRYFDGTPDPQLGKFERFEAVPNDPDALQSLLQEERRSREQLSPGDFKAHIAALRDGLIETEARRIVREMKRHYEPNSPNKTHFMAELSPAFMRLAATKDTDRLFSMLPYLCKIEQKENRYFEVQPYIQTMTEALKYRTGSIGKEKDYITREGIFRYMWMNTELTVAHKNFIYDQYPAVQELHRCIKEFRNIFKKRNIPLLYLFIEKYCKSELKALKSFAEGLKRDIDAIENAVAYDYSNGFVEGTNSRLKMIKRTMYGRC